MKAEILFYDRKMVIPTTNGYDTHYYDELMYVVFDKPYCKLYFTGAAKYTWEISLQKVWDNLPKGAFIKCRRSAIANLYHHAGIRRNPFVIVMKNNEKIRLTKANMQELESRLNNLRNISACPVCNSCTEDECEDKIFLCRQREICQKTNQKGKKQI